MFCDRIIRKSITNLRMDLVMEKWTSINSVLVKGLMSGNKIPKVKFIAKFVDIPWSGNDQN